MLKYYIALLLLPLCFTTQAQKKQAAVNSISKIVFEMAGRRGRTELTVTKDSVINTERYKTSSAVTKPAEWKAVLRSLKGVKLASMPLWVAPTDKRKVDAAFHCRITVYTASQKFESQYFDSGRPMKQLSALYNELTKIRIRINEQISIPDQQ